MGCKTSLAVPFMAQPRSEIAWRRQSREDSLRDVVKDDGNLQI